MSKNKNKKRLGTGFYQKLPPPFNYLARIECSQRREAMLLSMLTCMSSCLPNYFGNYRGDGLVTPHLYLFVSGSSGSGKGVLSKIAGSLELIDTFLRDMSRTEQDEYLAQGEDVDARKKPPLKKLFGSSDTSAASLSRDLERNREHGLLLSVPEADTLLKSISGEYGRAISPMLRTVWGHEALDKSVIDGDRDYRIPFPKLALQITGTHAQLSKFLNSSGEDGFATRFMYLDLKYLDEPFTEYADPNKIGAIKIFKEYALRTFKLLFSIEKLIFTNGKVGYFKNIFEPFRKKLTRINKRYMPFVNRMGISVYRIMMVLSLFRSIEEHGDAFVSLSEIPSCEDDYDLLKILTERLFRETLWVQESFCFQKQVRGRVNGITLLEELDEEFRYGDFYQALAKHNEGVGANTIKVGTNRHLLRLAKAGIIIKMAPGCYRKA